MLVDFFLLFKLFELDAESESEEEELRDILGWNKS